MKNGNIPIIQKTVPITGTLYSQTLIEVMEKGDPKYYGEFVQGVGLYVNARILPHLMTVAQRDDNGVITNQDDIENLLDVIISALLLHVNVGFCIPKFIKLTEKTKVTN